MERVSNSFWAALFVGWIVLAASHESVLAYEASSQDHAYRAVIVGKGLEQPWGLVFLPDGRMLVTERPGRMRIVSSGGKLSPPLKGLPEIAARGQGGLLDVALHPGFASNKLVYFSFSEPGKGGAGTSVARGRLSADGLSAVQIIFRQRPKVKSRYHFGSRLVFLPDGTLLISLGERGHMKHAQQLNNHHGTIVRVKDDGTIPDDNPFVGRAGALPEIYTYGNRNVQGMIFNSQTGTVWAHEHGPKGGDELNIIKAGTNYGWPAITYGIDYSGAVISDKTHAPGMAQPVIHWTPSIAPSGMALYTGGKFPKWRGNLFVGALKFRQLRRLVIKGEKVTHQEVLLEEFGKRIRDVRSGPDGYLYLLTGEDDGELIRLEPR